MADCGIKKYDELPGRVGLIDVDYLRYSLERNMEEHKRIIKKLNRALEKRYLWKNMYRALEKEEKRK